MGISCQINVLHLCKLCTFSRLSHGMDGESQGMPRRCSSSALVFLLNLMTCRRMKAYSASAPNTSRMHASSQISRAVTWLATGIRTLKEEIVYEVFHQCVQINLLNHVRGHTYMTYAKCSDFWTPPITYRNRLFLLSAFWGPPPPHPVHTSFKYGPF